MGILSRRKSKKRGKSKIAFGTMVGQRKKEDEPEARAEVPPPSSQPSSPPSPPPPDPQVETEEVQNDAPEEPVAEEKEPEPIQPSKKPTVKSKSESFNMCLICMGIIKQSLSMFVCTCNKVFHVSCGRRLGTCPNCSTELMDDMIVGKSEEVTEVQIDYEALPIPKLRLSIDDKLELLEERLILGEVSEDVYKGLKAKYEKELELGAELKGDEIYRCPSCNNIVDKNSARCSCGAIFSEKEGFLCPECNKFVPYEAKACTYCGVRFSGEGSFVCPSCGRTLEWGTKECSCGTTFSDELVEGFHCPDCGKFLEANASKCDSCGVTFF